MSLLFDPSCLFIPAFIHQFVCHRRPIQQRQTISIRMNPEQHLCIRFLQIKHQLIKRRQLLRAQSVCMLTLHSTRIDCIATGHFAGMERLRQISGIRCKYTLYVIIAERPDPEVSASADRFPLERVFRSNILVVSKSICKHRYGQVTVFFHRPEDKVRFAWDFHPLFSIQ